MKKIISVAMCLVLLISFAPINHVQAKKAKSLPKKVEMTYSSGMGAWYTSVTVKKNGTFSGGYHDAEGDATYFSNFTGKFTKIKKVGKKKYTMKMTTLKIAKSSSKYFVPDPPGVKKGKTYTLYCPGYDSEDLPEEVTKWTKMIGRYVVRDGKLTAYILCNTKESIYFLTK